MWLFSHVDEKDKWFVRRWMAVVAFRFLLMFGCWLLALFSYRVIVGGDVKLDLAGWAALLGVFTTSLTAIPVKYIHDATQDQKHEREQDK